jgi:hypothetical protein
MFDSFFFRRRQNSLLARHIFDPSRPLIFTHVPKTSGTAITKALNHALGPRRAFHGIDVSLFGNFTDFETFAETKRQVIFQHDTLPRDADLLHVHMAYSTTAAAYPCGQHFMVLREPYTRLLSQYLYWRAQSDAELVTWGTWGDRLRLARGPLVDFLSDERIACQTDNLALRMLLWPHRAIPPNSFISAADDASLVAAAKRQLERYAYVDAIERPGFPSALASWLGRQIEYTTENVTSTMSAELRTDFAQLLTAKAISLLRLRTRLDEVLWRATLGDSADVEALRLAAILQAVARYGVLMSSERVD